jgi:hypothetical protein
VVAALLDIFQPLRESVATEISLFEVGWPANMAALLEERSRRSPWGRSCGWQLKALVTDAQL